MKQITVAGNVTRDAETRTTQGGDKVTSWTVAVDDRSSKEKTTIFFDCSLWGKRGESLASYLTKGGKVVVSGDLGKREHDGKTYLTIRADQVTLMGGKPESGGSTYSAPQSGGGRPMDDDGDSIPFAPEWRI